MNRIKLLLNRLGVYEIGSEASKLFMIQIITMVISFLPSILVTRSLGPEMKGKYDLFNLLSSYITEFGLLGFGSGLLYYQFSKKYSLSKIQGTAVLFSIMMGVLISTAGILSLHVWKDMFKGLPDKYIVIAFIICPFSFYKLILNNILIGMNKAIVNYRISLLLGLFDFLFIIVLFFSNALSYSALILLISGETVLLSLGGTICISVYSHGIQIDIVLLWKALKYGIVLYVGTMANSILFKIDTLFINYFIGNEAVGIYNVAVRWAEMLFLLDSAISAASIYKISTVAKEEAKIITLKTIKLQFMISGAMGVFMLFAAYPLIYILYGKAYITATLPLIILLPGIISWSVGKILNQFIVYKLGKPLYCTLGAIIGATANMILNAMLIPNFGIAGAAVASTLSYLIVVGCSFLVFNHQEKEEICFNEKTK